MNIDNRTLFIGDNLSFLRNIDSASVDLVATDPPFNKSRDFHATAASLAGGASFQDRWSWDADVNPEWLDTIADNGWEGVRDIIETAHGSHSDGLAAYLCFMAVRLIEMHRILKPTGSIYLQCDHTAGRYLNVLLDTVFGSDNFRNAIVWSYGLGGSGKRVFSRKHDYLLFYSRSGEYHFDESRVPATSGRMKGAQQGMSDVWNDIPSLNNMSKERTGWPTQKPMALYERVILASSKPGDFVLDPFCGCATTCVAAELHGRQWAGIELWPDTGAIITERFRSIGQSEGLFVGTPQIRKKAPKRTDDRLPAMPAIVGYDRPRADSFALFHTKGQAARKGELQAVHGLQCQGCLRHFDHEAYLEVDHRVPREMFGRIFPDRNPGQINSLENLTLLCEPCARVKSEHLMTLEELQEELCRQGMLPVLVQGKGG